MSKSYIIMIVDDDDDDTELFCDAVKEVNKDIECISLSNSEEALRVLDLPATELPDYIFLDLNMPRLSGKQLLLKLKSNLRLRDIPVVIYTTSKLKKDMEETKQLGAAFFLTKPDKLSELRKAIGLILEGKYNGVQQ
ncbi:MAG: response regulator [Chitinophagaceae bacterium]|nr:response regulator [Chitinophagaceae bacterium]